MVVQVNEWGQGKSAGEGEPWSLHPQGCITWKPASLHEILALPGSITLHRAWALVLQQEGGWAPERRSSSSYSLLNLPASRGQDRGLAQEGYTGALPFQG